MLNQEDTLAILNELTQVCRDAELGFRTAAEKVDNSELETMFRGYEHQRAKFAEELKAEVERLGGYPASSSSLGSAMHRVWMDAKSALSGGDPAAIIAACESGEDHAEATYSRAASTDVTGKTRSLIESQWQQVKEAFIRIRRLKTEMAAGTQFPNT